MRHVAWLLAALLCSQPLLAGEKPKVAVLSIKAPAQMDGHTIKLLDEFLLTAIQESGEFEVFGAADIASMITLEEERVKLTGCADDACLAEIGGALGVTLLVGSSLGAVGDKHVVNVKLLDVTTAKVLSRFSELVSGGQAELFEALKRAAGKTMGTLTGTAASKPDAEPTATTAEPEATTTATVEEPTSFKAVAPWLTLSLAVAAAGAGGTLLGLGARDGADQDSEFKGTDRWTKLKDSSESKFTAGSALLSIGGAAAIATIVLFVLPDDSGATAGLSASGDGIFAAAGFGF